jgi:hypothetical protein
MKDALQPPYPTIRRELLKGEVIPFLGAGASLTVRTPKKAAWRRLVNRRNDEWEVSYIPTASELAKYLADESTFPERESIELAKVAQYFNTMVGSKLLYERLNEIFNRDHPFTKLHSYLAELPNPLLIVTTNYDDLIERAFKKKGRPYDLVVHTTDPSLGDELLWWQQGGPDPRRVLAKDLDIDLDHVTIIYKMHGAVDRTKSAGGQYVITEDDYIDFLARMTTSSAIPNIFGLPFQTRPFLFLGYGLYDWNLRVVLNRIEKQFRRPRDIVSWAIQRNVKALEQNLWSKRGVEVFDQDIEEFVSDLQNAKGTPRSSKKSRSVPPPARKRRRR